MTGESENKSSTNDDDVSANGQEKSTIEDAPATVGIKNEQASTVVSDEIPLTTEVKQPVKTEKSDSDEEKEKLNDSSKSEHETTASEDEVDSSALFEQPTILEGKRSRKPTLRLEIVEHSPAKKQLSIPQGHGKPLGEIKYINYQITHASTDTLSRMRYICFGGRGNKAHIRKNLREFNGFEFQRSSKEYHKHLSNLTKFKKDQLRSISHVLGLSSSGRNTDHAKRILDFLVEPVDEEKRIPKKKSTKKTRTTKKRSTNSKESMDTDQETTKENGDAQQSPSADTKQNESRSVKVNGHETTDSTHIAKPESHEVTMNNTDENAI